MTTGKTLSTSGEDSLSAIIPIGHLNKDREQNWNKLIEPARQYVFRQLRLLGITGFESHLKFEEAYTPVTGVNDITW